MKVQVNSLASIVEHLLKDSESKENKVNSLTSILQHFLEDSNLKETRITTLEQTVGELQKTINIQVELNSQANKSKQEKTAVDVSKQLKNCSKDNHEYMHINKHNGHSGIEKIGESNQEIGIGKHTILKSKLMILRFLKLKEKNNYRQLNLQNTNAFLIILIKHTSYENLGNFII